MQRFLFPLVSLLILTGCGMESLQRSDKPVSREEANKHISFSLPASASEVYFVSHADGLQEFEEFVRFTVAPEEMAPTVDALLAGRGSSPSVYDAEAEKAFQPMAWWTPTSIVHGEHRTADGQPIYIWIDTDHSIIFVYKSD